LLFVFSLRGNDRRGGHWRSAADRERLRNEAHERRSKRFADVFVRIHVTNRRTNDVLSTKTVSLLDPSVIQELFCSELGGKHRIAGRLESDLEAYKDYKVALFLIDLGGDGLRMAELACRQELRVRDVDEAAGFARFEFDDDCENYYFIGSEWEGASITVSCEFTAYRVGLEPEGQDQMWELCVAIDFAQLTDYSAGWDVKPYTLEDVVAVYELLEPFVNAPSLLKWH
jgi:hypothetical protein